MDATITSTKENTILGRKEISVKVSFDKGTPNRKEIKDSVCGKLGANPDTVVLREVKSEFGMKRISAVFHVYPTKEAALATEPRHILARDGMMEKKPKKAKKKSAPPAKKK